jgi:hypothetical protein
MRSQVGIASSGHIFARFLGSSELQDLISDLLSTVASVSDSNSNSAVGNPGQHWFLATGACLSLSDLTYALLCTKELFVKQIQAPMDGIGSSHSKNSSDNYSTHMDVERETQLWPRALATFLPTLLRLSAAPFSLGSSGMSSHTMSSPGNNAAVDDDKENHASGKEPKAEPLPPSKASTSATSATSAATSTAILSVSSPQITTVATATAAAAAKADALQRKTLDSFLWYNLCCGR